MSFDAFLRDLDASIHAGLGAMGSEAQYTPPAGTASACKCYLQLNTQLVGDLGQRLAPRTEVWLLLGSMAVPPVKGGQVVIDSATYTLVSPLEDSDTSLDKWVVRRG